MSETQDTLLQTNQSSDAQIETEQVQSQEQETTEYKLSAFDIKQVPEKFIDKETGEVKLQDVINSNKELEKKLHSRTKAPEKYDFQELFEENNLVFENEEQEKYYTDMFRDSNLSQEEASKYIAEHAQILKKVTEAYGPSIDLEEQGAKLREKWGPQTDTRLSELNEFAKTLPAVLFTHSPFKTAEGMEIIYELYKNKRGPTVIKDSEEVREDLRSTLSEIVANPAYHNNMHPDYKRLHKKAGEISQKIALGKK